MLDFFTMQESQARYSGEFALTKSGSIDFGEISPEIAKTIKRQAGKIRLRIGVQVEGEKGNYGERHIERPERIAALKKCGYENARDFIEHIYSSYEEIYQGQNGSLILVKSYLEKNHVAIVKLMPSLDGDFYDVQTGYPSRKSGHIKKPLLWKNQQQRLSQIETGAVR